MYVSLHMSCMETYICTTCKFKKNHRFLITFCTNLLHLCCHVNLIRTQSFLEINKVKRDTIKITNMFNMFKYESKVQGLVKSSKKYI